MTGKPLDLDPPTHYQLFCTAVGRLFLMWARLEGSLAAGLRLHLESRVMPDSKARARRAVQTAAAIYGSMRFSSSRDTMRRIAAQEDFGPKAMQFFDDTFAHLGNVAKLRDLIAHQLLLEEEEEDDERWQFTDVTTTKTILDATTYEITTTAVFNAANDAKMASDRLGGFLLMPATGKWDLTPFAWLYKPAMLKPLPKKRPRSRRSQQRPPQS